MGEFLRTFDKGLLKTPIEQWFWNGVGGCRLALIKILGTYGVEAWLNERLFGEEASEDGAVAIFETWSEDECEIETHILLLAENEEEWESWRESLSSLGCVAIWCELADVDDEIFFKKRVRDLLTGRSEYYQSFGLKLATHKVLIRHN
jgi:hypothetical protein